MRALLVFSDKRRFNHAGECLMNAGIGFTLSAKGYEVRLAPGMTQERAQHMVDKEIDKRLKHRSKP